MHRTLLALTSVLVAGGATAQMVGGAEQGRVISSTPVIQQVAVPRQVCQDEVVTSQGYNSGAGAVMGGLAGGAIGNAIGDGSGRAAATVIGLIGGAMLGNRIEGSGAPQTQTVRRCGTQTVYENRTVGFQVVYEYAGRQYQVQMPHDPGPTIPLQVVPLGAAPAVSAAPLGMHEQVIYQTRPVYPAVVRPAPPVVIEYQYRYNDYPRHRHGRDDRWRY
jgi:uncharacterized protein YcfJ